MNSSNSWTNFGKEENLPCTVELFGGDFNRTILRYVEPPDVILYGGLAYVKGEVVSVEPDSLLYAYFYEPNYTATV